MKEYVNIVEGLEPGTKVPLEKRISMKVSQVDQPGSVRKKGTLYKQRDVFKGWRARHFVLQDCFLHYYLDADDPVPRNTLDLTGCSVTSSKAVIVDGIEYFPFTISHPKSKTNYNLSSDSKLEADIWVAKILEAATANNFVNGTTVEVPEDDTAPGVDVQPNGSGVYAVTKMTDHSHETRAFIPADVAAKLERLGQLTIESVDATSAGWEPLVDKSGVLAKKRSGHMIHIKAETEVPYAIYDVFSLLTDLKRQLELDNTRASHERLKDISMHSWVDYISTKPVWPTSPRDMVNFVNWRVLNTGQILLVGFSHELYQSLRPPKEGTVRADMVVGSFLLTSIPSGTKIQYLLQTDLKGSIPATVVSFACSSQAMFLANFRKVMDKDSKAGAAMKPAGTPADYSELVSLMAADSRDTAPASISQTDSKKVVPNHKRAALVKLANRSMKLSKNSLVILLLPILLYYVVEERLRAVAFLFGILIAHNYLFRRHLGQPIRKVAKNFSLQMPSGKLVMRFPVDLARLLMYLDSKRADSELEMTFTHIVVKAVGLVLLEMPSLNGHVVFGSFYRSKAKGVDVSVSLDVSEKETVAVKIEDVDAKPLECVSDEILGFGKTLRSGGELPNRPDKFFKRLDELLPTFMSTFLKRLLYNLGAKVGLSLPVVGIIPYPLGVCTIINSPNLNKEEDMDLAVISDLGDACAPITVTMSGMRANPAIDSDKKISAAPVLNFSVAMSTYAASVTEMRRFCGRLQELLNDPNLIDKIHAKSDFDRQENAKRKLFFGGKK